MPVWKSLSGERVGAWMDTSGPSPIQPIRLVGPCTDTMDPTLLEPQRPLKAWPHLSRCSQRRSSWNSKKESSGESNARSCEGYQRPSSSSGCAGTTPGGSRTWRECLADSVGDDGWVGQRRVRVWVGNRLASGDQQRDRVVGFINEPPFGVFYLERGRSPKP